MFSAPRDKAVLIECMRFACVGAVPAILSERLGMPVPDIERELASLENKQLVQRAEGGFRRINDSGKFALQEFYNGLSETSMQDYMLREFYFTASGWLFLYSNLVRNIGLPLTNSESDSLIEGLLNEGCLKEDVESPDGCDRIFQITGKGKDVHKSGGFTVYLAKKAAEEKAHTKMAPENKSLLDKADAFLERPAIKIVLVRPLAFLGAVVTPLYIVTLFGTAGPKNSGQQENIGQPTTEKTISTSDTLALPQRTDTTKVK